MRSTTKALGTAVQGTRRRGPLTIRRLPRLGPCAKNLPLKPAPGVPHRPAQVAAAGTGLPLEPEARTLGAALLAPRL